MKEIFAVQQARKQIKKLGEEAIKALSVNDSSFYHLLTETQIIMERLLKSYETLEHELARTKSVIEWW